LAVGPCAQPGTSSSLKRTVIVLTFPFGYLSFSLVRFFFASYLAVVRSYWIKEKGPRIIRFAGPLASISTLVDIAPRGAI
jgi:hypothetical protein